MITLLQYFTNPNTGIEKMHSNEQEAAAAVVLQRRQALREEFYAAHPDYPRDQVDPDTGTEISGARGGGGAGGFRLPEEGPTGDSSHKCLPAEAPRGAGVDDYDPDDALDNWLTTFDRENGLRNEVLERHRLFREHPSATRTWCHLTDRAPKSGKRTFYP